MQRWLASNTGAEKELVRGTVKHLCFACRNPCRWQFGRRGLCWEGMNQRRIGVKGQSGPASYDTPCSLPGVWPAPKVPKCELLPASPHIQTPKPSGLQKTELELTTKHAQNGPVFSAGMSIGSWLGSNHQSCCCAVRSAGQLLLIFISCPMIEMVHVGNSERRHK